MRLHARLPLPLALAAGLSLGLSGASVQAGTTSNAAAAGTPLVTADVGGLGEAVIDGRTGLLFPPRDIPALAAAVCAVLDDPAGAAVRAQAARARLTEEFEWPAVAARTAQVYRAATRRERAPSGRRPIPERPLPDR